MATMVVAGCSSESASETTASELPGFKRIEGDEVSISLPESFEGGNLSEDLEVISEKMRALGPQFEQMAQVVEQNPSMFQLWAFDQEIGPDGGLTNVNITTEKILSALTLEAYADATLAQFPETFTAREQGIVPLGDYMAARLILDAEALGVTTLVYLVEDDNTMWNISFSTGAGEFDERLPIFEQSALTFTVNE
jgi:hypothetical protein